MMTIFFVCGHRLQGSFNDPPKCAECGETRIRSVQAPAPRFTGAALGPCATYRPLSAIAVPEAAPKGPLLRESETPL